MIQVSDFIAMFAMNTPSSCIRKIDYEYFFMLIWKLYLYDIRLSNPYGYSYLLCVFELGGSGGDSLSFIVNFVRSMPSSSKICNAVNNSTRTATSAHETCTFLTSFQTLETLIPQLHEARIRFRKNQVTGVFNITGRYTTMSAPTMEQLISNVLEKQREYRRYIDENRKQKILNYELR